MRVYLYILAGVTSALIGLSIGQFFVEDLGWLDNMAEVIIFPCVAIALSIGMVLNEIFLSTPTRAKLNFRLARTPIFIATGLGLLFGLLSGGLMQFLFIGDIDIHPALIRVVGWLVIGSSVGFAEGFTWRWRSIEAGNARRFYQRLATSSIAGCLAGLAAALLFELLRGVFEFSSASMGGLEDPLGFAILGGLLGFALSQTTSPSYMVALRAGAGFEYIDRSLSPIGTVVPPAPRLRNSLTFISRPSLEIEEGLSIQLPAVGKVRIGSAEDVDIYIPNIAKCAAQIDIQARTATIQAVDDAIQVNGRRLAPSQFEPLKHNHILTLKAYQPSEYASENNAPRLRTKDFYRFVYYNRFLDPQA